MTYIRLLAIFLLFFSLTTAQNKEEFDFNALSNSKKWQLKFQDSCTQNWQSKWFVDGKNAEITNTDKGMDFSAGKIERNDAYNAVLWTKESFEGNTKIVFEYTKTDLKSTFATILYLQATGIETTPYEDDITKWNQLREIPSMKTYYQFMKALHISFASYENDNTDLKNDYIRARQYPVISGQNFNKTTEIPESSFNTGLFLPNETYSITVIKTNNELYFNVTGKNFSKLFFWNLSNYPQLNHGRIGLRHMFTRSARYKNFSVYTLNN